MATISGRRPKRRASELAVTGGTCPLCGRRFDDITALQFHASGCNAQDLEPQVRHVPSSSAGFSGENVIKSKSSVSSRASQTCSKKCNSDKAFVKKCLEQSKVLFKRYRQAVRNSHDSN